MKSKYLPCALALMLPMVAPCVVHAVIPDLRACVHALDPNVRRWADLESRYRDLSGAEGRTGAAVNGLLNEGFGGEVDVLRDLVANTSDDDLAEELELVEREWRSFFPVPYLDRALDPLLTRFQDVIDLMNGGPFLATGLPVFSVDGRPVIDRADFARRYFFGDGDPFVIGEYHWAKLERLHRDRVRAARVAYLDLEADRQILNALVTPVRETLDLNVRISSNFPRIVHDLDAVRRDNERPDAFRGWTVQTNFDVSDHAVQRSTYLSYLIGVPLPVGAYGLRLNRDLRRTVQILARRLRAERAEAGAAADRAAPTLLAHETSRGRARGRTADWSLVTATEVEGFVSIAQFLSLLLHDRLGGAAGPDALVAELLTPNPATHDAPLTEFTRHLRTGVLKATTLSGLRYPRPLIREAGTLRLRPAFRSELTRIAGQHHRERRLALGDDTDDCPLRDDRPCPLAVGPRGADGTVRLQAAADAFLRVYRVVARGPWQLSRDVSDRLTAPERPVSFDGDGL